LTYARKKEKNNFSFGFFGGCLFFWRENDLWGIFVLFTGIKKLLRQGAAGEQIVLKKIQRNKKQYARTVRTAYIVADL